MKNKLILPDEVLIQKIYIFRDKKVMIDSDLAQLYQVETRVLNQAIRRNESRFPSDFMFELSKAEFETLQTQNQTNNWGGRRSLPKVFTEHGILMLSSILNSEKAVDINIQIVRIFIKMRDLLITNKDILQELDSMRSSIKNQDNRIDMIYNYLKKYISEKQSRTEIGYKKRRL